MTPSTKSFALKAALSALLAAGMASAAIASPVTVSATASPGAPVKTGFIFAAGDSIRIDADPLDLWAIGSAATIWSNANGLTVDLYATGSDDSGMAAGTKIGAARTSNLIFRGLSAPYGSLVGEIGGTYFLVGTHFEGAAPAAGELHLLAWDSGNFNDNRNSIVANVNSVPEPSGVALAGLGLSILAFLTRGKRQGSRAA